MAKIRFLDQVPIGVFETPTNTTNGSFSGSFTGSFFGTASWSINALTASFLSGSVANAISASYALTASFALNAGGGSNISGAQYFVPLFNSTSSLITSSIFQSGSFTSIRNATTPFNPSNPDILYINGDGIDTYNLMSAHTDIDSYAQINVQNFNPGATASSDVVATADIGSENDHYIDMGINGSGYNDPLGIGLALDAYLYSTGQDLLIGNKSGGNKVIIFNGDGPALDNARVFIDSIGTVGINASDPTVGNPEALLVEAINNTTYNLIRAKGSVDNFLQTAIVNSNTGSKASADIVAYNDLDSNSSAFGFIDMGINSSNFNDPTNYPGWNAGDSYLYTDASRLIIGSTDTGSINFFIGNNPTSGSRFKIKNNNQHEITGSLNVSGSITAFSFTGSLLGTASYATQALSASFTTTSSYVLNAISSSYASTASVATSSSYALTASYASNSGNPPFPFTGNALISGSLTVQGSGSTIFVVSGSNGIIFSIIDSGSSSNLFSVSSGSTDILTVNDTKIVNISGSLIVTGSIISSQGFTGSLLGTSSYANNALSASFTTTSSYALNSTSASYALSASYVLNAVSASYASSSTSASYALRSTSASYASSSTSASYALTASYVANASSFPYTGSAIITGSLTVTGSIISTLGFTGSLLGTASYATIALTASYFSGSISTAVSASYAATASYVVQSISASYASTASYFSGSITQAISASYAATASYVINSISASYSATSSIATSSSYALTASYVILAQTASYILQAVSASYSATASISTSASYALSASYAPNTTFPYTGSAIITGSLIITGTISLGDSTAPAVYTSVKTTVNAGSTVIYNVLTSSYDSAFFDYSLKGSSGARAGNIMAMWSGSSVSYTDNSTADMGNTADFVFGVILSGSNMVLTGSTSTNGWILKTAVRTI